MTYATDGRCHNAETGTYGHECGKPATWIATTRGGNRTGFCDDCAMNGYEARSCTSWTMIKPPPGAADITLRIAVNDNGRFVPRVEQTAQGAQLVMRGGERSAHQAASARAGRIRPRKPQQEPGGLFAPRTAPQPSLFDE